MEIADRVERKSETIRKGLMVEGGWKRFSSGIEK